MEGTSKQTRAQLLAQLRSLCEGEGTGTVCIMADTHRLGRFLVEKGHIIAVHYANYVGEEALRHFAAVKSGTWLFREGPIPSVTPMALPPTAEILHRLLEDSPAGNSPPTLPAPSPTVSVVPGAPAAPFPAEPSRAATSTNPLSAAVSAMLEQTLSNYIGPIARLVCQRQLPSARDLQTTIAALARGIPDLERAQAFMQDIQRQLQHLQ